MYRTIDTSTWDDPDSCWTDQNGKTWKTPSPRYPIGFKYQSHRALRAFIRFRDKACKNCGSDQTLEIDHIRPRHLGGNHHPNNLQLLCQACNLMKEHAYVPNN